MIILTDRQLIDNWTPNLSIAFALVFVQHANVVAFDVETARALLTFDPVDADDGILEKVCPDDLVLAALRPVSHVLPKLLLETEESLGAVVVAEELAFALAGAERVCGGYGLRI